MSAVRGGVVSQKMIIADEGPGRRGVLPKDDEGGREVMAVRGCRSVSKSVYKHFDIEK